MDNTEIELVLNENGILSSRQQRLVLVGNEFMKVENIKRNAFPNAVLIFKSAKNHVLITSTSEGIGQCVAVLSYEFNYEDTDDLDDHERKRYSELLIGGEVFKVFNREVILAFIKHKKATLIPINDQHARALVKIFYKTDELGCILSNSDNYTKYNY